jgi:Ca2+-binding RTX toxin-like protein
MRRSTTSITMVTSAVVALLVPVMAADAAAPVPTCFSEPATIVGTTRPDDLTGTPGRDVIVGRGGEDFIAGLGGADLICGGEGSDVVSGGDGRDRIRGDTGDDNLNGGEGDDVLLGLGGIDSLFGEGGSDRLLAGAGAGIGTEGLIGGAGDDVIDGGPGLDTAQFFDAPGPVRVDLGAGSATGHGTDRLIDVEGAIGSNFDDVLIGDAGGNGLSGQLGADTIRGLGSGSFASGAYDVLSGDDGADRIVGGGGFDMVAFVRIPAPVTVDLAAGMARGQGSDTLDGVEGIIGSRLDDVLLGDGGDNGFAGGTGDDHIDGRGGRDTVSYFEEVGPVTVDLAAGLATNDHTDELLRIENVWGTVVGDVLVGDGRANELLGRAGRDRLEGGAGDDLLHGGPGPDRADGGDGSDTCLSVVQATDCESTAVTSATVVVPRVTPKR